MAEKMFHDFNLILDAPGEYSLFLNDFINLLTATTKYNKKYDIIIFVTIYK